MNNAATGAVAKIKTSLAGTLTSGSVSTNVILSLDSTAKELGAMIPPGGFIKEEYGFTVPPTFRGRATLEIGELHQVVTLEIRPEATDQASPPAVSPVASTPAANASKTAPLVDAISNNIRSHLSGYEPIYFILGSYPAAEFQYSVKYKVLNIENHQNPLDHLYFEFTQTSLWDLISPDPSFYDTSYKPSVFLYYTNVAVGKYADHFNLDLQGGAEHESNGRGGTGERSLYTAYLQPTATLHLPDHFDLTFQPRARTYFWLGQYNPDIADYRGYADLLGALTWHDPNSPEEIQFATKFQIGDEGAHPGLKFDLRFNLALIPYLGQFNPTLQVQYFTGYGQSLRQYNQDSHAFRVGLCLWYDDFLSK
jgi:outer membrane phospholipase A